MLTTHNSQPTRKSADEFVLCLDRGFCVENGIISGIFADAERFLHSSDLLVARQLNR